MNFLNHVRKIMLNREGASILWTNIRLIKLLLIIIEIPFFAGWAVLVGVLPDAMEPPRNRENVNHFCTRFYLPQKCERSWTSTHFSHGVWSSFECWTLSLQLLQKMIITLRTLKKAEVHLKTRAKARLIICEGTSTSKENDIVNSVRRPEVILRTEQNIQ